MLPRQKPGSEKWENLSHASSTCHLKAKSISVHCWDMSRGWGEGNITSFQARGGRDCHSWNRCHHWHSRDFDAYNRQVYWPSCLNKSAFHLTESLQPRATNSIDEPTKLTRQDWDALLWLPHTRCQVPPSRWGNAHLITSSNALCFVWVSDSYSFPPTNTLAIAWRNWYSRRNRIYSACSAKA